MHDSRPKDPTSLKKKIVIIENLNPELTIIENQPRESETEELYSPPKTLTLENNNNKK